MFFFMIKSKKNFFISFQKMVGRMIQILSKRKERTEAPCKANMSARINHTQTRRSLLDGLQNLEGLILLKNIIHA